MRKAVGILIIFWGLSHFFTSSFAALDDAGSEVFKALEAAATTSQQNLSKE